jgi:hypothetical protein
LISARTKAALAASTKKLGGTRYRADGTRSFIIGKDIRALASAAIRASADRRAAEVLPTIRELQAAGAKSLRAIAASLNELGIPTARGTGAWSAVQVMRILDRS